MCRATTPAEVEMISAMVRGLVIYDGNLKKAAQYCGYTLPQISGNYMLYRLWEIAKRRYRNAFI